MLVHTYILMQANLNLRNHIFPFLNKTIFDSKIFVINLKNRKQKKMSYVGEFVKLGSFINQKFTVHTMYCNNWIQSNVTWMNSHFVTSHSCLVFLLYMTWLQLEWLCSVSVLNTSESIYLTTSLRLELSSLEWVGYEYY